MGGAMRQAGIIAAGGVYALRHHVKRLAEDHANARRLAQGLADAGFDVRGTPETNIVLFHTADDALFQRAAREVGVLFSGPARGALRAVTHLDVGAADVDEALARIRSLAH
jgi:threonine aldolase